MSAFQLAHLGACKLVWDKKLLVLIFTLFATMLLVGDVRVLLFRRSVLSLVSQICDIVFVSESCASFPSNSVRPVSTHMGKEVGVDGSR